MKKTTSWFAKAKSQKEKITMLTAYDYSTAKLLDQAGVDSILVGDSLGMVMLGYDSTLKVTMDDMIHHTKAVVRGTTEAMVISDLPFLSYHISPEEAVKNAGRLIQEGGAQAVKLEGGREMIPAVEAIIKAQIPVVGHLGLTPQSVNIFGGFKVQGKELEAAQRILEDALLLQEAGVFAIVLECVPEKLSQIITEKLNIPTIGIGAGNVCDGQVLVVQDMLGTFADYNPKFVKTYGEIGENTKKSVQEYIKEVQEAKFPSKEHTFSIDDEILSKLY